MTHATTLPRTARTQRRAQMSMFEFWPGWAFYTPVVVYWILMGLRYRDLSLPTAANPRIASGGLCGESKSSILDMAGEKARAWIAPYVTFSSATDPSQDLGLALDAMRRGQLQFPLVLKPDVGCNGTGVKLVQSEESLEKALKTYPRGVDLMLQALIPYDNEAGIFYIRHPDEAVGRVTSITYKKSPVLSGDGISTIQQLVLSDPRTSLVPHLYLPRLQDRLDEVPDKGENVRLVFAGNHCKGSIFLNGGNDITNELVSRVDEILRDIPDFHFGRIDVKFTSVPQLRRGLGFQIIEINGVGSEATHIWDKSTTLREAYAAQFMHYRETFLIGSKKKKAGWKSTKLKALLELWFKQRRLLKSYPMND